MLQKTCRDFAEKEIKPVAAHNDENKVYPKEIIKKLGGINLKFMRLSFFYKILNGGNFPR